MDTFHQKVQNYHVSYGLVMFIFFFVFFTATGIYLTQVLPHAMGFRENPLFCLIVCKKNSKVARRKNQNQDLEHHRQDDRNFEMDLMRPKDDINTLRIENLTKHYGSVRAVQDLSVEMYPGQIFALLGHNGAGKTTTIKMIIGLIESTSGQMIFKNKDLALNRRQLHNQIGVCPQENILYDQLTVLEHF